MANGKVCTGFSLPYVALYKNTDGTITYSDAQPLARGVDVSITPDSATDSTDFYADNVIAESESADGFTGGELALTVDGLKEAARKLIMGTPEAGSDGWTGYGDDQKIPFVGFGYIARFEEEGKVTYVPTVLAKVKFAQVGESAATSEENVVFTTQSLTAAIKRGDDSNHNWKYIGAEADSETAALTALRKKLGATA